MVAVYVACTIEFSFMAEIAGVALAVPAVIDALIKGGANIYTRVEEARKIDETLGRQELSTTVSVRMRSQTGS